MGSMASMKINAAASAIAAEALASSSASVFMAVWSRSSTRKAGLVAERPVRRQFFEHLADERALQRVAVKIALQKIVVGHQQLGHAELPVERIGRRLVLHRRRRP